MYENANAIFNNRLWEIQNHNFTRIFKDELNEIKLKFYQAFRFQELSEYYDGLINFFKK